MSIHDHTHANSQKPTSSPKRAAAPAKGRKINWHRIMWNLSEPDPNHDHEGFFRGNFFREESSNRFWLEPEVYTGPTVKIPNGKEEGGVDEFTADSLCFRVQFDDGDMSAAWENCVLFPAGSEALKIERGAPIWAADTQKLAGWRQVEGDKTLLTICMDENHRPTTELYIRAERQGVRGHLGMGVAHQ